MSSELQHPTAGRIPQGPSDYQLRTNYNGMQALAALLWYRLNTASKPESPQQATTLEVIRELAPKVLKRMILDREEYTLRLKPAQCWAVLDSLLQRPAARELDYDYWYIQVAGELQHHLKFYY